MKTLSILVVCMMVNLGLANNTIEDLDPYKVVKTEIIDVSPFCISVVKGDFEMVKKMFELGTDVNKESEGLTPLMYAARYNRIEIIKLLVANNAEINDRNTKGYTAMKYAKLSNATDAIAVLKSFS